MADIEDGEVSDDDIMTTSASFTSNTRSDMASVGQTASLTGSHRSTTMSTSTHRRADVPGLSSSESDDDSDNEGFWKRKRTKQRDSGMDTQQQTTFKNPLLQRRAENKPYGLAFKAVPGAKRRPNNIWGSVIQEQSLTQGLSFGIGLALEKVDNSRDVESYDYTKAQNDTRPDLDPQDGEEVDMDRGGQDPFNQLLDKKVLDARHHIGRKRKMVKERLGKRSYDKDKSRDHLDAKPGDSVHKIAECIIQRIQEPKVKLVHNIVDVLGGDKALHLLYMTEDVEDAGGMMINNGARRRTPGGVYIQLMKSDPDVSADQVKMIFSEEYKLQEHNRKKAKAKRKEERKNIAERRLEEAKAKLLREMERVKGGGDATDRGKEEEMPGAAEEGRMEEEAGKEGEEEGEEEDEEETFEKSLRRHMQLRKLEAEREEVLARLKIIQGKPPEEEKEEDEKKEEKKEDGDKEDMEEGELSD